MSTEQNKSVVRHFVEEVINGYHMELAQELLDPEFVLHFPGRAERVSAREMPQFASEMQTAFPDWHVTIDDMIAEGDKVVILTSVTGTQRGTFQGMPATGKSFTLRGLALFTLRNGKLLEQRAIFDRSAMLEQLGMMQERRAA